MSTESRIAALELELAELKKTANVAPPPSSPPKDLDRPLISYPAPPAIALPDASQARKLVEIISRAHLNLTPRFSMRWHDDEEREWHAGFMISLRYIATLGRTATPDTSVYLGHWVDRCKDWARLLNDNSPAGNIGVSFFLAAIASGDVPYQLGNNAIGVLPAVGLKLHGGTPASADGWRRVLEGQLLAPVQARRYA